MQRTRKRKIKQINLVGGDRRNQLNQPSIQNAEKENEEYGWQMVK